MPNVQGKKIYLALPYSHSNPEIRKARFDIATAVSVSLMKQGAVVRISQNKLFNLFSSDTSLNNHSPLNVAASALSRIAEVRYEFTVKSKYKYGDSIFIIDDNNEIQEQEVTEIAIAFIQGSQTISYNGFHSKLVFAFYDAAKKALEANFI